MLTRTTATPLIVVLLAAWPSAGCNSQVRGGGETAGGVGGADDGTTTTTASVTAGPSTTGGHADHPLCLDPDPAVDGEVVLSLSHWAPDLAEYSSRIELQARCTVGAASRTDRTGTASLACTDDDGETFDAELRVDVPPDVSIALTQGQAIDLELAAHGTQGEVGPGMRFAMRDDGDRLLLAAYADETYGYVEDSWSSMIAPLQASMDLDICPSWSCPTEASPECPDGGTYQRHGLIVNADDERVHLSDRSRDVLMTPGGAHDVVVMAAAGYFKISSRFRYAFLIATRR